MKPSLLLFGFFFLVLATHAKTYNSPNAFIENKGQIIDQNNQLNPAVKYLWTGNGMKVQLKANSFSYEVLKADHYKRQKPLAPAQTKSKSQQSALDDSMIISSHRVDVELLGANPNPEIITGAAGKEYLNYYTTATPEEGVKMVHQFNKVTYQNIYPNIDLEFVVDAQSPQGFKYNFLVKPGGNVAAIQLQYQGADKTELTANGSLTVATSYGDVTEQIPTSYEQETGKEIKVNYALKGKNVYGFEASNYNSQQTLVIDPWCTYYGWGDSISLFSTVPGNPAIDASHNILVCGYTANQSNIATIGAYQTVYGGGAHDVYIRKFNSSGFPIWCTYYGGIGDDMGFYIVSDELGNSYVSGSTDLSTNMGTVGTVFPALSNLQDSTYGLSYFAKFNSSGFRLWGTYYPAAFGPISLDHQGNLLYVSNYAGWGNSCVTSGAFQTIYGGGDDICIVKFNSSGQRLWATYYGGDQMEGLVDLAVDNNDNIVVSGYTESLSGIATSGTFQTTYNGLGDLFIVKFNSNGQRLWGTYYGSPGDEGNYTNIATDGLNNIYITGRGGYPNFFATVGAFLVTPPSGSEPLILAKFNSFGQRLWGTYFGGPDDQFIHDMKVDNHDNVIFCGETVSSVGIASINGHHPVYGGDNDGFIEKFSPSGARIWGSYYGGVNYDGIIGMDLDDIGNIIVSGATQSDTGVATPNAYCHTLTSGFADNFLAYLDSTGNFIINGIGDIKQNTESLIKVYPNPVKDKIIITLQESTTAKGTITVVDVMGKVVKSVSCKDATSTPLSDRSMSIDIKDLPVGVYMVQYEDGEVCEAVKVVKE
jgi:hypothetical protein